MQNYQNNRLISNMNMNVNTNNISNSNNNVNATSRANIDPSNSNTILTNNQTNNQNSNQNNPVTQSRCGFSELVLVNQVYFQIIICMVKVMCQFNILIQHLDQR